MILTSLYCFKTKQLAAYKNAQVAFLMTWYSEKYYNEMHSRRFINHERVL